MVSVLEDLHSVKHTTPTPPYPGKYCTASAELWCFRNKRNILRGEDVFLLLLSLSLLAVLRLLDVEGVPLLGAPFPLGIVEYLLWLEVSWRLVSSVLETLNCFFRYLKKYKAKARMTVNTQPAIAAPITWPISMFDPSLALGPRCISTSENEMKRLKTLFFIRKHSSKPHPGYQKFWTQVHY